MTFEGHFSVHFSSAYKTDHDPSDQTTCTSQYIDGQIRLKGRTDCMLQAAVPLTMTSNDMQAENHLG